MSSFEAIEKILICPFDHYPDVQRMLEQIGIQICVGDQSDKYSFDMFVLSESSLIVDKTRNLIILQTCGQSRILDVLKMIKKHDYYYFLRTFSSPKNQPYHYQSLDREKAYLREITDRAPQLRNDEEGVVEMWNGREVRIPFFYEVFADLDYEFYKEDMDIRIFIKNLGVSFQDHSFTPCGYSINLRIDDEHWMTVHISPPEKVLTIFCNQAHSFDLLVRFLNDRRRFDTTSSANCGRENELL